MPDKNAIENLYSMLIQNNSKLQSNIYVKIHISIDKTIIPENQLDNLTLIVFLFTEKNTSCFLVKNNSVYLIIDFFSSNIKKLTIKTIIIFSKIPHIQAINQKDQEIIFEILVAAIFEIEPIFSCIFVNIKGISIFADI